MRIHPILYGILVLALFFGTILGFQAAGVWSVSGKVTASGEQVQPLSSDVNTLKGWMTLEQVSNTYNVSLEEISQQFNLPGDISSETALKDLESDSFDVTTLRDWLEARQTAASEDSTAVPGAGVMTSATETPEIIEAEAASLPPSLPTETLLTPAATLHTPEDRLVTGKTTFQDLLDWGVSKETIEQVIGDHFPALEILVKDEAQNKGLEFPTLKAQLQAEVDKLK